MKKLSAQVFVTITNLEELKKLVSRVEADINQLDKDLKELNQSSLGIEATTQKEKHNHSDTIWRVIGLILAVLAAVTVTLLLN